MYLVLKSRHIMAKKILLKQEILRYTLNVFMKGKETTNVTNVAKLLVKQDILKITYHVSMKGKKSTNVSNVEKHFPDLLY